MSSTGDAPVGPRIVQGNRRAAPRVRANELEWLQRVRLAHAGAVSLIDLSARGASFEVSARVRPGEIAELEFLANGDRSVATVRIVRSEVAGIGPSTMRYRSAGVFAAPQPWARRLPAAAPDRTPTIAHAGFFRPWWGWSEAVVVFRHSRHLRGFIRGFDAFSSTVDVWPARTAGAHQKQTVPLALLRAIHVVRDLDDEGSAVPADACDAAAGLQVEVAFRNNEVLRGTLAAYDPEQTGFWVLSVTGTAAHRVFAVSSAVAEIRVF